MRHIWRNSQWLFSHIVIVAGVHRPSGLTREMPCVCRGFETGCDDFIVFALASIEQIPTKIFYNRDRNNLYRNIDCIGDYYYYDDNSESYHMSAC